MEETLEFWVWPDLPMTKGGGRMVGRTEELLLLLPVVVVPFARV